MSRFNSFLYSSVALIGTGTIVYGVWSALTTVNVIV